MGGGGGGGQQSGMFVCCQSWRHENIKLLARVLACNDGGSGLRLNDGLDIKLSQVGWGLMLCLWPGPLWFN